MAVLIETLEFEQTEFYADGTRRTWLVVVTECVDCPADPIRECWEYKEILDDTS